MILEFTGLSGVGKSTLEPYLISGLKQRGFEVVVKGELKKNDYKKIISPDFKASDGFLFNQLNRLAQWNTLKSIGLRRKFFLNAMSRHRREAYLWLSEDIILSAYFFKEYGASPGSPSVYISQEGFVHHCACLKLWKDDYFPDLPKKIIQKFPQEKITIIYFKISVEEALDRVLTRKRGIPYNWPRKINSRSKVKEVLIHFNEAIEEVVENFQAEGVQVLPVDSSLELKQVQFRFEDIMDSLSQNRKNRRNEQNPVA